MPNLTDSTIVRAAIHPGIGIARIGNSESGYFIGPEVTTPQPRGADYYRDQSVVAAQLRKLGILVAAIMAMCSP